MHGPVLSPPSPGAVRQILANPACEAETVQVLVVGLGYIGLPTAALIAASGQSVLGVDIRADVVDTIAAGNVHIEEANLADLVASGVASGALRTSTQIRPAETFIIAVPTPLGPGNSPDLRPVMAAAQTMAPFLRAGSLVILESTCPVGTTEALRDLWADLRPDLIFPGTEGPASGTPADIAIAYCPERVLPGRILEELVANDRCIGGITPECAARAAAFYRRFVRGECRLTSARVAEMVKLAENSFRDVNIAFANELSLAAEHLGVDVWDVIALANRHPRVNILSPGPGVGGHCIAIDPWFLIDQAPSQTPLMRSARRVNVTKMDHVTRQAAVLIAANPDTQVGIFGLTFKADVDDLRESPAMEIAARLAEEFGPRLCVVEPHISVLPPALAHHGAALVPLQVALDCCDILILLVDHREFRSISAEARRGKQIYDVRGIWRSEADQIAAGAGGT